MRRGAASEMKSDEPNDLIPMWAAKDLLHVSLHVMQRLVRTGVLRQFPHPLDIRQKLVSRREALALKPRLYVSNSPYAAN